MAFKSLFNINVGVLGHVDSGKTSLVAALSTTLSTAALDKNPQSKERGITLDLGFSAFVLPAPPSITAAGYDGVQFTLVDCPGHASLIRTVVGGAQIMDMMVLVVDVTKGIQTQTAECIVIGEITTDSMIVVLNKIDQLDPEKRDRHIKKAKKLVAATLAATKFSGSPMVAVSARPPPLPETPTLSSGLDDLKEVLLNAVHPRNNPKDLLVPFLFFIDHCFVIKGQGTVLTGTVAKGRLSVGDVLELPAQKQQRKVKSMQIFRRPVSSCQQGDRVGICVTQLEAATVERGIAAAPGSIPTFSGAILAVDKVRFYPGDVKSQSKMHVIVGHQTVMAKLTFFGQPPLMNQHALSSSSSSPASLSSSLKSAMNDLSVSTSNPAFDFSAEYLYQEELYGVEGRPVSAENSSSTLGPSSHGFDDDFPPHFGPQWAVAQFEEAVTAPVDSLLVGARLDADTHAAACRITLSGRIVVPLHLKSTTSTTSNANSNNKGNSGSSADPTAAASLSQLKVYKLKSREGSIERIEPDGCTAVCKGMFGKDSDLTRFLGMKIFLKGQQQRQGILEGSFGKSGKFKVRFSEKIVNTGVSTGGKGGPGLAVVLQYKRFVFDTDKRRIAQ